MTRKLVAVLIAAAFVAGFASAAQASSLPRISVDLDAEGDTPEELVGTLQILVLLTILTLAPAILVLMTSFTRIVVVLSFVRSALGTQQVPPNQVLIGLALFLTLFTMLPTLTAVNDQALQPYLAGEVSQTEAWQFTQQAFKDFMLRHTREKDLSLFVSLTESENVVEYRDVSLVQLVPAFVISELKTAFQMGFMLYVPFLVIDMVVASTLMSMGMLMLPPVMIALPFKVLLFVLVDGWHLVIVSLLESFH